MTDPEPLDLDVLFWLTIAGLVALLIAAVTIDVAHAGSPDPEPWMPELPGRWTADDVQQAIAWSTPWVRCVIRYEVGGVGYDPNVLGRAGEIGPGQLHPQGLLPDFVAEGFTDPNSPYQVTHYMEGAYQRGLAHHWTPARWC
mgnify:FL=1